MSVRWHARLGVVVWLAWGIATHAQTESEPGSPPGLAALRHAAGEWDRRMRSRRQVVDQVCLVPDLPTFLDALAAWDEGHFFPILIDDPEWTLKFVRAFRPARIVRYPSRAEPLSTSRTWEAAVRAVEHSRRATGADQASPGVILSSPDSPSLAGAAALAAGRSQPLVKLEFTKHHTDALQFAEARAFAGQVAETVARVVPRYDGLGDDCDFLTVAGDWPYRYEGDKGDNALDDLLGRSPDSGTRWAFTGRLIGDPAASAYRAMCSLFLQPRSALLFNGYNERDRPWSDYRMSAAALALGKRLSVTHRSGERASLAGWHEILDPVNRFGLMLINTHGDPTRFNLPGGPGQSADVPPSGPTAVLMIHSFSAADPYDPDTLAGRWLAQGAFLYYGSMNEPYLQAFRSPSWVGTLAAAGIPLSAAVRESPPEPFGRPWRLVFLGDPLYRLDADAPPRLATWASVAEWPRYPEYENAPETAPVLVRLNWAAKTALFRLQREVRPTVRSDLADVLRHVDRSQLPKDYRPAYDALLADTLLHVGRAEELFERVSAIPADERSPQISRLWQTLAFSALQRSVARRDFAGAAKLWSELIATRAPQDFHELATGRVSALAGTRAERLDWRQRLRAAAHKAPQGSPTERIVADELKRVSEKLSPASTAR